jgi:hypothetical protein
MLGNVVVAGMILGEVFGVWTVWMVFTWFLAFILMSGRVSKIREELKPTDTLHSFLHRSYRSIWMRKIAALVTLTVGIGVFSIELIAGMALLVAILPASHAHVIAAMLIFLLIVSMCVAGSAGGLRAVIETDSMLWPVVITGVGMMVVFSATQFFTQLPAGAHVALVPSGLDRNGVLAFLIGVGFLQVPLLLADYGTWQRVKATRRGDSLNLAKYTFYQAFWQAALWAIPAAAGMILAAIPAVAEEKGGALYNSSFPLIEDVAQWLRASTIALPFRVAAIFVFSTGMLAVMASTANSYLIIAMETWVRDLNPDQGTEWLGDFEMDHPIQRSPAHYVGDSVDAELQAMLTPSSSSRVVPVEDHMDRRSVARARKLSFLIAFLACLPIVLLVSSGINLMGIIVIVFSIQVALAPASALAIYAKDASQAIAGVVALSTISAMAVAIAFGLWSSYGGSEWWANYGVYLTSAVALGLPTSVICIALIARGYGIGTARGFLSKLLWPWG